MSYRIFFFFLILSCLASGTLAQKPIQDQNLAVPADQVQLEGFLGQKIDLVIENRIKAQDIDHLIKPFRNKTETRLWQSEFWGKWFLSAADAYAYTKDPELKDILDRAVTGLSATQDPDGYIGNYAPEARLEQWDIWGRKYTLLGLLAYYDLTRDKKVLETAEALADNLLTEVGPGKTDIVKTGNYKGMASSSILEPIVLLYNRSAKKEYLDFARYIVRQWETEHGPQLIGKALSRVNVADRFPHPQTWYAPEQGQKAYEMMSCYDGLLELYRIEGDEKFLKAADLTARNIIDTEINAAGSGTSMECWYGGKARQTAQALRTMEACVGMTWIKFLFQLHRITGNPAWIDQIEMTVFNALSAAMTKDGSSFAMYTPLAGTRQMLGGQCGMDLNCCNANAPRAFVLLPSISYMTVREGLVINLYEEGEALLPLGGNKIKLEQSTNYPLSGAATIKVSPRTPGQFTIKLRIPAWSKKTRVTVEGKSVSPIEPGTYLSLSRYWEKGDSIELELDMRGRVDFIQDGNHRYACIHRGPILLARDSRFGLIDEDEIAQPQLDQAGYLPLSPTPETGAAWMLFTGKFLIGSIREGETARPRDLPLCDFSSAGNSWDQKSRYRVWLPQPLDPTE